jgi:hypothetical protein
MAPKRLELASTGVVGRGTTGASVWADGSGSDCRTELLELLAANFENCLMQHRETRGLAYDIWLAGPTEHVT